MRPNDKLLATPSNARPLYATATLESGWFSAIKSIETPAVIAVRDDWYRATPRLRRRSARARRTLYLQSLLRPVQNPSGRRISSADDRGSSRVESIIDPIKTRQFWISALFGGIAIYAFSRRPLSRASRPVKGPTFKVRPGSRTVGC
jgi:hypothetical protein